MHCIFCLKEIREEENRYYSWQAGMKGNYHWDCFVEACHEANRIGAAMITSILNDMPCQYALLPSTIQGEV